MILRGLERLPAHMHASVRTWIDRGQPHPRLLGAFLRAVLLNDLVEAFACGDEENARAMRDWARFLYNDMPAPAWRTEENLDAWHERGGICGRENAERTG